MSTDFNVTPVDDKKPSRGRPRRNRSAPAAGAPAQKNGNGLDTRAGLGAELWKAADILRGAVSPDKYDVYLLPLLFYKRLSDVYVDEYKRAMDEVGVDEIARDSMYHRVVMPDGCLWSGLTGDFCRCWW